MKSEAEHRRILARRDQLEADMRAEGAPEWMIARNATYQAAERMLAYERQVDAALSGLFGVVRS